MSSPKGEAMESLIVSAGACSPSKAPSRSALQIESAIVTAHSRASLLRGEGAGSTGGGSRRVTGGGGAG